MTYSYRWWAKFPGAVYANNFDFNKPVNEKQARAEIRSWLNGKRIPRGTEVYPGRQVKK